MKPARAFRLLPYLLLLSAPAHAAPPAVPPDASVAAPAPAAKPADPKRVTLKADTLTVDVPADSYRAAGSVVIVQDGVSLLADSVVYNRLSGNALAQGGVFLDKSGDTLKGDRLSLNMISQQGELSNGELFVKKSNFRVRAARVEKTGEESYRMERGSFTTCDGDNPSWRFEARDVVVTLDEFATARDAVFYAGDIPLLYTPYLIFPVMRERQSGLLIPRVGRSSKRGFYIDQPYYWAIDPSRDATFNLDIESSRGVGGGADYRYMRAHGSEGHLQGFGIFDTQASRFRGELHQKHLELLPRSTIASDIHLITDRSYYLDYGEFSGEYNRQLLESTASFGHGWDRYGLTGELRYTEDLLAPSNDATLQKLPVLKFVGAGERLGPFFYSMDAGLAHFQRNKGTTGERLELHPRLTLYSKPSGALDLSVYAGYRERLYSARGGDARKGVRQVGQADAGALLALPLERVYDGRLRHLMTPSIEYGFVQHGREDDLPFFDYDDRVPGQSAAGWSLVNVLTEKVAKEGGGADYRDLLYLKLSQGYQFSGERRDLLTLVDEGHRLTDLMLESRVTPMQGVTVNVDGRYNPVDGNLSTANLAVEAKGEGSNRALLGYRFSRGELDYLEGTVAFPINGQLSATVVGRYSFDKHGFLDSRYALEYKRQCWSVVVAYSDRPGNQLIPGNKEISVNFTLAGLGALGPIRAF